LVFLRARYYQHQTGRFLSPDLWDGSIRQPGTLHKYVYALANPIRFADPSGRCVPGEPDFEECVQLASVLAQAYGQPKGTTPGTVDQRFLQFYQMPYLELQALWAQWDPVRGDEKRSVIEREAMRFGLPPEFVAAAIAAEVEYDTDLINTVYDVWTGLLDWAQPDRFRINIFAQLHLELWHCYYGLGPLYLNPKHGFGEGPAPGIGNMHVGVAKDTELYFANTYPGQDMLPTAPSNARRLELIHRYEWNVRYVAAYLRQLADMRTGIDGPHHNLSDNDMAMIFVVYHADLNYCFDSDDPGGSFQRATSPDTPECQAFAEQLTPFLHLYRQQR
jgi:hypothetical protein